VRQQERFGAVEAAVARLCNLFRYFLPLFQNTITSPRMAPLNTVVDLSEEIVFDKVKWIQQNGRNYPTKPSDVPLELQAY